MHTVFALLCFVVVIHWLIFPYPSDLLHWHCGNLTIAPVPAKQPWWIWINTSCEFIMNDCVTTTKQSTTKPCANFLGYTVCRQDDRPGHRPNSSRPRFAIYASVNYAIVGSDKGLSPARRQPIIWTINGLLSISLQATYLQEILFGFLQFRLKKMHFKMSSAKRQPSCLGPQCVKHCIR